MATAEAVVCNVALFRIGHTKFIESLEDKTLEGKACALLFPFARDQVLQARPWPFATLRAELAVLADDEDDAEHRTGWAFTYALPSDCIAPRFIWSGTDAPSKEQEVPFRLESSRDLMSRVLLTNMESAELVYTAKVVEMTRWDPLAREALAMKLASDLAFGFTKKRDVGQLFLQAFMGSVGVAHASAANQNQASPSPRSEFELGRR